MEQEPLIDIPTVARRLGVSYHTVWRMIKKKKVPAVRIGKQWRFDARAIEEMISKNQANKQKGGKS